jgi:glycerol-3-phosphate acyltransferase PlsY
VALSFVPAFASTFYFQSVSCLMTAIIIFKHRENIRRLLSGTENRLRL